MIRSHVLIAASLAIGSVAAGCASYDSHSEGSPDDDYPEGDERFIGLEHAVAHLDRREGRIVMLRPQVDGSIATQTVDLVEDDEKSRMYQAWSSRDGKALVTITGPRDELSEDVAATLNWVPSDAGALRSLELDAPYTAVAFTPDHRRALLYFGTDEDILGVGIHNANQLSIVDLQGPQLVQRSLTLEGFGGRLSWIQFPGQQDEGLASPVDIAGVPRDLALFYAEDELILHDLDDPGSSQVAIRLDRELQFRADESLLRPGDAAYETPVLFVRSGTSADVAMLGLIPKADEITGAPGFSVQPSLLSVGTGVTDFAHVVDGTIPYLVSLRGQEMVFSDIRTQQSHTLALPERASDMRLRPTGLEPGAVEAIVWAHTGNTVFVVDLANIKDVSPRRIQSLHIAGGIDSFVELGADRAVVGSGENLYIVDFTGSRTVTPLASDTPFDPRESVFANDHLVLGPRGTNVLNSIDMQTLVPNSMVLPDAITGLFGFPNIGKVLVTHADSAGYVTVVDAREPTRATSKSTWGYLVDGVIDRDPKEQFDDDDGDYE